jgi:hypothetical protein
MKLNADFSIHRFPQIFKTFLTADVADFRRFFKTFFYPLITRITLITRIFGDFLRMLYEGTINSPPVEGWRAKRDGVVCLMNHNAD